MGNVEDVRKAIQDMVAPDLKAMAVRFEALEKEMNIRFNALEKEMNLRFIASAQQASSFASETAARFTTLEKEIALRFMASDQLAASRHEAVVATMTAHHTSIMNSLEMDKRLARLEGDRVKPLPVSQEQ